MIAVKTGTVTYFSQPPACTRAASVRASSGASCNLWEHLGCHVLQVFEVRQIKHLQIGATGAGLLVLAQLGDHLVRRPSSPVLAQFGKLTADRRRSPLQLGLVCAAAEDE